MLVRELTCFKHVFFSQRQHAVNYCRSTTICYGQHAVSQVKRLKQVALRKLLIRGLDRNKKALKALYPSPGTIGIKMC